MRTGDDPLINCAQLVPGMSFLDCTLGLASDSIIAQLAVGKAGKVVGLEAHRALACLVRHGLATWREGSREMLEAMRAIEVIAVSHHDFLTAQPDDSFDVVYFDPMFEQTIDASTGLQGLKAFATDTELLEETIAEANRVASKRVILKDHWQSTRFKRFGFTAIRRKHASFHYGYR